MTACSHDDFCHTLLVKRERQLNQAALLFFRKHFWLFNPMYRNKEKQTSTSLLMFMENHIQLHVMTILYFNICHISLQLWYFPHLPFYRHTLQQCSGRCCTKTLGRFTPPPLLESVAYDTLGSTSPTSSQQSTVSSHGQLTLHLKEQWIPPTALNLPFILFLFHQQEVENERVWPQTRVQECTFNRSENSKDT